MTRNTRLARGSHGVRRTHRSTLWLRVERLEDRTLLSFSPPTLYGTGPTPRSVALGDFNGDGALDLVTANDGTGNLVSVLLNNGDGTFQPRRSYSVGNQPVQVVVGDFNNDKLLDVATANLESNNVSVLLGNGDGTLRPMPAVPVSLNPRGLAVGDFNGDGVMDLVVGCTNGYTTEFVDVLSGNGAGTFRLSQHIPHGGFVAGAIAVTAGDFNHDGHLDFATADAGYLVSRFEGRGDGTFVPAVAYPAGHRTAHILTTDLNGDGILDLVVAGDNYGTYTMLRGRGNGTFEAPVGVDGGAAVFAAVDDFDADGKPDVVV